MKLLYAKLRPNVRLGEGLGELISTSHANALRCSRAIQHKMPQVTSILPCCCNGILDGEKRRRCQKQWWLSHCLWWMDRFRIRRILHNPKANTLIQSKGQGFLLIETLTTSVISNQEHFGRYGLLKAFIVVSVILFLKAARLLAKISITR